MPDTTPEQDIDQLLEAAIAQTEASAALARLHTELVQARDRLKQPMRVAIVGLIKAGKSTTMNALLGEEVVATGTIETTFNVNWLCYGDQKSLEVHFKDGRPVERHSFDKLSWLTKRSTENAQLLHAIKYIKVYFPNEMFHTLQLIDTPGLWSVHGVDSANARAFINVHEQEEDSQKTRSFMAAHGDTLNQVTLSEASQADAVLYLFRNSLASSAAEMIKEFQGPLIGSATPINSIGVLTKIDAYWPGEADPRGGANRVVKRLQSEPVIQRLFYAINPVSSLLALGVQTLTEQEFNLLKKLSSLSDALLRSRLRDAERFMTRIDENIPLTPDERALLYKRLGQYGIWRACQYLRDNPQSDLAQLRVVLLEDSGLPELQKLIMDHFGKRAFLIKLDSVLRAIEAVTFTLRSKVRESRDVETLKKVASSFEKVASEREEIAELRVLRDYYEEKLTLKPGEAEQLLQITGERGAAYWQRLGIEEANASTLERLEKAQAAARQSLRYWRQRLLDPSLNRQTRNAVQVLARAYERMLYHLREATRHLTYAL